MNNIKMSVIFFIFVINFFGEGILGLTLGDKLKSNSDKSNTHLLDQLSYKSKGIYVVYGHGVSKYNLYFHDVKNKLVVTTVKCVC